MSLFDELREAFEPRTVTCPACESTQLDTDSLLGILGAIAQHRCRYCGMLFTSGANSATITIIED